MRGKPNVLLIPGFMCDAGLWHATLPVLQDAAEVHFCDLSRDASIDAMAERALAEAPDRFVAVGFSMGGYVAREIALRQPDRVSGLVLANSSARGSTEAEKRRNQGLVKITARQGFKGLSGAALRQSVHPDRAADTALLADIDAMARRLGGEVFLNQLRAERDDGHWQLRDIRCPALVIWSRQDRLRTYAEARALTEGLSDARFEIIEDCGHMTPLEKPQEVAGLLIKYLGLWGGTGSPEPDP